MNTAALDRPVGMREAASPAAAARALLAKHWDGRLPVNPFAIARAEGLTVRPMDDYLDHDSLRFSGYFSRSDGEIVINADESAVRQRFTMAHELGHYALGHENAPRDSSESFNSGAKSPIERAANQFAAELLMPSDTVAKVVRSGTFASVDELARAFNVSKVAMTYRINNLGLLV